MNSYPVTSSDTALIRFIKNSAIHIRQKQHPSGYINIWHAFTGQDIPEDIDIARHVACIIIGDPTFEIRALDARDYIDYCMATHEYERLATLANDALDLYLKGVISLHEFKLIIAANKN